MKEWTVEIYVLDQDGKEKPARCFHKAVYHLHPSFANPVQSTLPVDWAPCRGKTIWEVRNTEHECVLTRAFLTAFLEPPFKCTNEGWGEFEMSIDLFTTEKGGKQSIMHDLNFAAAQYENIHTFTFKNPSQALQQVLRETGPLPSDEERKIKKADGSSKKKKAFDVEKMADGLIKLGEDDLLQVIQLIHDHKDDSTYVQNNVDAGEFSVDLYTLPDSLLKMLWDLLVRFLFDPSSDELFWPADWMPLPL